MYFGTFEAHYNAIFPCIFSRKAHLLAGAGPCFEKRRFFVRTQCLLMYEYWILVETTETGIRF